MFKTGCPVDIWTGYGCFFCILESVLDIWMDGHSDLWWMSQGYRGCFGRAASLGTLWLLSVCKVDGRSQLRLSWINIYPFLNQENHSYTSSFSHGTIIISSLYHVNSFGAIFSQARNNIWELPTVHLNQPSQEMRSMQNYKKITVPEENLPGRSHWMQRVQNELLDARLAGEMRTAVTLPSATLFRILLGTSAYAAYATNFLLRQLLAGSSLYTKVQSSFMTLFYPHCSMFSNAATRFQNKAQQLCRAKLTQSCSQPICHVFLLRTAHFHFICVQKIRNTTTSAH